MELASHMAKPLGLACLLRHKVRTCVVVLAVLIDGYSCWLQLSQVGLLMIRVSEARVDPIKSKSEVNTYAQQLLLVQAKRACIHASLPAPSCFVLV